MSPRLLPMIGIVAASTIALAGCSADAGAGSTDAGSTGADGISVVATTTQMADFVRQVAGDAATVTQLLQPNSSAHTYDPTPADLLALGNADVLVENGAGLETWLDAAIEASGFDGTMITASDAVELADRRQRARPCGRGNRDRGRACRRGCSCRRGHADDADADEHDADAADPHIWTSVPNAIAIVDEIVADLSDADPDNAATFESNGSAYTAKLDALDAWITAEIRPSSRGPAPAREQPRRAHLFRRPVRPDLRGQRHPELRRQRGIVGC